VRADPWKYAQYLKPCVRAYFAKRVCIVGAESTGTTTLARALALHYHTVWVPEYGRFYTEGKITTHEEGRQWRSDEFEAIAQAQTVMEESLAESAHRVVIADTDAFATSLWHERYMGGRSSAVEALALDAPHDLYILTGDEIPFVQDGIRDGEHVRHAMHDRFAERLEETGKKYIIVRGTPAERLEQATAAIDKL
jgi:NadR type nicotinamide-nucleotide adenylyltransferase